MASPTLRTLELRALTIDDEAAFLEVPLYRRLKAVLVRDRYRFRVLPAPAGRWDRALFLNLTFWGGDGGDVLPERRIAADVVTHAAWHHLAARTFRRRGRLSVDALFGGEAIASAFDLWLLGTLLVTKRGARSAFVETQVPAMAESADAAGLSAAKFEKVLHAVARDPDRAFEDLRALLVDATAALHRSRSAESGLAALERFRAHRFAPLLHRYELSNWVLWARAWAADGARPDRAVRTLDRALRAAPSSVAALTAAWLD